MTILSKNLVTGTSASTVPGTPGSPGHPAYCIDVPTTGPSYTYIAVPDSNNPGQYIIIPVTGPNVTTITHECFPATAPTPAGPPTVIPSVAANYYTGWNAAADSIATLAADGMFQVSADASAIGIVVGLTPTPVEPGYSGITHGIYFASGAYQYFENGVALTPATAFVSTDVFTIRRLGTQVAYYKGTTLDYTSLQASTGAVYANASLYFGGDRILSAAFVTPVSSGFAGIGQRGTFDPVPPNSPPPTTYGVPPQYVSVAGQFNDLRDYITDSNLTIVSPGPTPGSPGAGPPDSNGDWSGRSGGTLRELVGVATAYNNGTVAAGPPPPSTGPDPGTGDWSGRSGSSLRGLTGQIFGSTGSGTAYSTVSGTLTGLAGNAGAALLAPNYAVDTGYLGGMGGFAIALAGMNGVVQGTLPDLEGFATNSTGAYTNPDGPPPPSTGPDPVTGDWPGRAGGQLRQLVGQIYSFPIANVVFDDKFDGTGTLATNPPNVGGPFTVEGGGSASGYTLNGSGGLPSAPPTAGELVSSVVPPGTTYTITEMFTPTVTGADTTTLEVAAGTSSGDLVNVTLVWNGSDWVLTATVTSLSGMVLYTSSSVVTLADNVSHTITVAATGTSTTFSLDGAVIFETSATPGTSPTQVTIENVATGPTSSITLDEVMMTSLPVDDAYLVGAHGGGYSMLGFAHEPQPVQDSNGNDVPGYGMYGTHGGGYTISARTGAIASGVVPEPTLNASATTTILAEVVGTAPTPTIVASATTTLLARLQGEYTGKYTGVGLCGATLRGTGPRPSISAHGIKDGTAELRGNVPNPTIVASASVGLVGNVAGVLPSLQPGQSGVLVATGPRFSMVATAYDVVTVEYEAYSVTLIETDEGLNTATSHYTNYPFDRIVRFGSTYYGVAADGLYELSGNDFNGAPIVATVLTADDDFDKQQAKRPVAVHMTGTFDDDLQVSVLTDGVDSTGIAYKQRIMNGQAARRITFGRGARGHWLAFKFTNAKGKDFSLETVEPEVDVLRRAV